MRVLAASGGMASLQNMPTSWSKPLLRSVTLSAHAVTSCADFSCSTDDPFEDPLEPTTNTNFGGEGGIWSWNQPVGPGPDNTFVALIPGLKAITCPNTSVTVDFVDISGSSQPRISGSSTVISDESGVASFTERVRLRFLDGTVSFGLRFVSEAATENCIIPFCFSERSNGCNI